MAYIRLKKLNYVWEELTRGDKTSIMTAAIMRHIFINGNGCKVGMREINVNIGKNKSNLRIDVLEINRNSNTLIGYEVKSCIQDFRTDKKWRKYLELINYLFFVFDNETYEKHKEEILEKIGDAAGIYVYYPKYCRFIFEKGCAMYNVAEKDVEFYKTILFNYLWRKAQKELAKGE